MTRVPVARRSLFAERRRALLGIAGVATALLLVLVIDGVFAGAMRRVTRYIDTSEAEVFVSQDGVRNMHMASSTVPLDVVDDVRAVPGVDWAEPILYESGALVSGDARQIAYVIGFRRDRPGGPTRLIVGDAPADGEIVLDERAAEALGVRVGDEVETLGRTWTISGLTTGMDNIANSVSYIDFDDFAETRQAMGTASFVLVGTTINPSDVAARISQATGMEAVTRDAFSGEERRVVRDMAADLMAIMAVAALVIGLVVVALTLYTVTLSRLRDIGVLKAIGATVPRLALGVVGQAAWVVGAAVVVAVPLAAVLGKVAGAVTPNVSLAIELPSVLRVAAGGAVLAVVGAIAPLLKVARVEPASVFRRAS